MQYKGMSAFPRFVFNFCIALPVYIVMILPSTIAWNVIAYPFKKAPNKSIEEKKEKNLKDTLDKKFNVYEIKNIQDREYDIVVFGATGFTGQLAAKYLARQYGTSINWAIAGRSKNKLQEVK